MGRKKKESSNSISVRDTLVNSLKLPKDMLLGASMITMTGNRDLWIENYRGIMEYTDQSIILQTKTGRICIQGCGLKIDYYTNEDMKIIGNIQCIRFS